MKYKFENDWTKDQLKGKIKSYSESEYILLDDVSAIENDIGSRNRPWIRQTNKNYDTKGNVIRETNYDSAGRLSFEIYQCFNEMGNLIEKIKKDITDTIYRETYLYGKNGVINEYYFYKAQDLTYSYKDIFGYDYKGNLIERKSYNFNGTLKRELKYEYDQERNLIELQDDDYSIDSFSRTSSKYDDKGNRIESTLSIPGDETFIDKTTWRYNEKSYCIAITHLSCGDSIKSELNETYFSYDDVGNTIEMKFSNRESFVRRTYKYDQMRNLIEESMFTGAKFDKLVETVTYKYNYDNNGNWIMRIYFVNGKPKYATKRVYEYYD